MPRTQEERAARIAELKARPKPESLESRVAKLEEFIEALKEMLEIEE